MSETAAPFAPKVCEPSTVEPERPHPAKVHEPLVPESRAPKERMMRICVQGTTLLLMEKLVTSHDWLPAKMLTSEVPFAMIDSSYYLDVDPPSFRIIVSILSGVCPVNLYFSRLDKRELILLTNTARYLLCTEIADQLQTELDKKTALEAELEQARADLLDCKTAFVAKLEKARADLLTLNSRLEEANSRLKEYERNSSVFTCTAYRQHCPYNVCANEIRVTGDISRKKKAAHVQCLYCRGATSWEIVHR